MKEFITQNWYYIALIVIAICNMFLLIFKKGKISLVDSIFERLLVRLPSLIRKAEELGVSGENKKIFVLSAAYSFLADMTGKKQEELVASYGKQIDSAIEDILATPEKKEVE